MINREHTGYLYSRRAVIVTICFENTIPIIINKFMIMLTVQVEKRLRATRLRAVKRFCKEENARRHDATWELPEAPHPCKEVCILFQATVCRNVNIS